MNEEAKKEYLTITLTDRAPVRIVKDDWPIIASSKDWDNQYEAHANRTWKLTVRQHHDGRAIVYGISTTQFQGEKDHRGGELLDKDSDLAEAIRRVGEDLGFSDNLIDHCIADLPAVELQ